MIWAENSISQYKNSTAIRTEYNENQLYKSFNQLRGVAKWWKDRCIHIGVYNGKTI